MKEEDKLSTRVDKVDMRIEYMSDLFNYMFPDVEPSMDWWFLVFPRRYNEDKINLYGTYKQYLKSENIQLHIKAFEFDQEKFWYFMLFLYDISFTKSTGFYEIKKNPKDEVVDFRNELKTVLNVTDEQFVRNEDQKIIVDNDISIELRVNGKKRKVSLNDKTAIVWLSLMLDELNTKIEGAKKVQDAISNVVSVIDHNEEKKKYTDELSQEYKEFDQEVKEYEKYFQELKSDSDYLFLEKNKVYTGSILKKENCFEPSKHYRNYLIIYYFFKFLEMKNIKGKKKGKNVFDKKIFASEVLKFFNLIEDDDCEDYVKNTISYYKSYKCRGFSVVGFDYR